MQQQLTLDLKERFEWGGKRRGAGRPRRPGRRRIPHAKREIGRLDVPLHVTLRLLSDATYFRSDVGLAAVQRGIHRVAQKGGAVSFHAILGSHIHLIVELGKGAILAHVMNAFSCAIAKALNRACGRRGAVFEERYHARSLETPTELWRAIRYVLCQSAHHDTGDFPPVDPFTSYAEARASGKVPGRSWLYRLLGMTTPDRVRRALDQLVRPEDDLAALRRFEVGPPSLRRTPPYSSCESEVGRASLHSEKQEYNNHSSSGL